MNADTRTIIDAMRGQTLTGNLLEIARFLKGYFTDADDVHWLDANCDPTVDLDNVDWAAVAYYVAA